MKKIAIITARGGSKRIPRKNIKEFCGKPILAYSIEAALESGIFDEVMVSTDDEEIAEIARRYGASVPFYRSEKTSGDFATAPDVVLEVLEEYEKRGEHYDLGLLLYPTAPFVTAAKLKDASEKRVMNITDVGHLASDADTLVAVVQFSYPPQRGMIMKEGRLVFEYPQYLDSRSQDLEPHYHDVGQFLFFHTEAFKQNRRLLVGNLLPYVVSEMEVQDIDNQTDWEIAEMKYRVMKEKEAKQQ